MQHEFFLRSNICLKTHVICYATKHFQFNAIFAMHGLNMDGVLYFFQSSREQLAIAEFARSLLVIPKQLAVNAAQDSTDLVAKLRAFHNTSQMKPEHKELKW